MNKDVGLWAKTCVHCQKVKVTRHTISRFGEFQRADRFEHVHLDLVGPLPTSQEGYRYLLTLIDRTTRWPEAFPLKDISANTVAKAFYEGWIVRFGCPVRLTSDQGTQFESHLFNSLLKYLGVAKSRTTHSAMASSSVGIVLSRHLCERCSNARAVRGLIRYLRSYSGYALLHVATQVSAQHKWFMAIISGYQESFVLTQNNNVIMTQS